MPPAEMRAASSSERGEINMYVIVVGSPAEGFTVIGPLDKPDDDGSVGEWARAKYSGSDWYQCELREPSEAGVSIDKTGDYVIFDGDIETPFAFFGPFTNYDVAVDYVERFFGGWALMLHPIDREDIAA
jgi:hypothetical protein